MCIGTGIIFRVGKDLLGQANERYTLWILWVSYRRGKIFPENLYSSGKTFENNNIKLLSHPRIRTGCNQNVTFSSYCCRAVTAENRKYVSFFPSVAAYVYTIKEYVILVMSVADTYHNGGIIFVYVIILCW